MAAGQLRNENQNFGTIFYSCVSEMQHGEPELFTPTYRRSLDQQRAPNS
jgi:hypothetical protein